MKHLYLGAAGDVDPDTFTAIREEMSTGFDMEMREVLLPDVEFARDERRNQYGSIAVMEMLQRLCPRDAGKLLAVTEKDLFIPVLTFVFGQAQLGGRVAVVSLARLRQEFYGLAPNREVLRERARKEALHEAGHLFGLVHCADRTCAMALATGVRQIDGKRAGFCPPCTARLERRSRE